MNDLLIAGLALIPLAICIYLSKKCLNGIQQIIDNCDDGANQK